MKKIINYIKEAYSELTQKVSWPTTQELTNSSIIVLIASIIIAMVVWAMDLSLRNLMDLIYSVL
jgi:preprotein translocase subunit SecE